MTRYQIFQKLPGEQPTWVEAATELENARNRLQELTVQFPAAAYFIFDTANANFIIPAEKTPAG